MLLSQLIGTNPALCAFYPFFLVWSRLRWSIQASLIVSHFEGVVKTGLSGCRIIRLCLAARHWGVLMGCRKCALLLVICFFAIGTDRAVAVGWGPTAFLIFGAPNFPDRIGVFDQNFAFKGYIFTNWDGLTAMNFDQQGRLVAFNTFTREVRVFDSSGAQVGGFSSSTSPMLTSGGDIQVMPDGNYILGTSADGARVFTPDGTFVRQ